MFEFHGWICIKFSEQGGVTLDDVQAAIERFRDKMPDHSTGLKEPVSAWEILSGINLSTVVAIHGLRNHHYQGLFDFFSWVTEHLPRSYGLLYVQDGEHHLYPEQFLIYRLSDGQITVHEDTLLSLPSTSGTVRDPTGSVLFFPGVKE